MTKITYIPGEIANAAIDEHGNRKPVTRTHHIFDDAKGKTQQQINAENSDSFENHQQQLDNKYDKSEVYNKEETYSKAQLNNMITTPNQKYVTLVAESGDSLEDIFNGVTGESDTTYRVGNWDGSANSGAGGFDVTVYSEYAFDGTDFIHLSTKTQIGEVFDISAYHATGGVLAEYADLTAAIGTNGANIPDALRKGGMSVKFVQSSDNKYVQYRYMGTDVTGNPNPFLDTLNWEKANYFLSEKEIQYNQSENGALATDGTIHYTSAIGEKRYIYQVEEGKFYKLVWAKAALNLDYMIVYVGDNNAILGYYYRTSTSNPLELTNYNIVLPTGTKQIVINSNQRFDEPQMDVISYFSIDDVLDEIADVADDVNEVANDVVGVADENKKQKSVLSSIQMVELTKEVGYYYNANGEKTSTTVCFCSNVTVSEGEVYYVTGVVYHDAAFYLAIITDSNNNVLARIKRGAYAGNQYIYNEKIVIPAGGAHLLLTSTYRYGLARDLYAMSLKKEVAYSLAKNRIFDGKKVAMFGDSIFAIAGDYPENRCLVDDFAEIVGGNVLNFGFGGTTMGLFRPSDTRYTPFSMCMLADSIVNNDWTDIDALSSFPAPYFYETVARLKETNFNNVDVVILEQITNDWANLRLEPTSDIDLGCYVGGLRHAVKTLQTAYPHLKIFVWSGVYRVLVDTTDNTFISDSNDPECTITASGKSLREWNERAKEVCEELNVTFVDNYNIGIGRYSYPAYFPLPDGTHPNAKGCARIAQSAASKMY